ncbi:MAG: hypothetical protein M3N29_07670 [Chloroflexota bacterium]|nr:hypothetical protein [Chloroflexota bacterium]
MPADRRTKSVPADPREWRPLEPRPTRRPPEIRDPIIEPLWDGTRVIAHFRLSPASDGRPSLELRDAYGDDRASEAATVGDALAAAVMAVEAVIDGVLTNQATASGIGTAIVPQARTSAVGMMLSQPAHVTVAARGGRSPAESELAFVALDLLSVDEQPLLDLPLLERKRQLESVVMPSQLVRVTPFARPPLGPWLNSWRSAGFRGVMLKAANSRYQPGELTLEWAAVTAVSQR